MKPCIVKQLTDEILELMTDYYPETLYGFPKDVIGKDKEFSKEVVKLIHEAVETDAKGYYYL
jgi:hypothetical protein